ncbi:MlaD family protein [Parendozoicomonas haliclonae]|uniref:Paraquat-inducible protein B n=1 Tax=Parendozoicomonas haliclonae TaxID=1960125 RepID=A0A1X7AHE2_9GAMM|nr:MlaD family protein [Parendozoicomonas haliclonae]SMA40297.1 Paraquat-inducible protein B [Parendozoicomonas haliclonae]
MNTSTRAVGVGLFIILMLALGVGMALVVSGGDFWDEDDMRYELVYNSSVKGLETGAPVTLKGVQIGEVVTVKARFYKSSNTPLNSIVVNIDPGRIDFDEETHGGLEDILLDDGLSAKLKMQSFLTGRLYIELDYYRDKPQTILVDTIHPQIPTVPSDLEKLNDFNDIDFVQMADHLQQVLDDIHNLTSSPDFQNLPAQMNKTLVAIENSSNKLGRSADAIGQDLEEAMTSLKDSMNSVKGATAKIDGHLAPDSPLIYRLNESLESLTHAATAVEELAETLEEQPEALLTGKREKQP